MFSKTISAGLLASAVALSLGSAVAQADTIDQAAAQLAGRADSFAASSAGLQVLPLKMAGACPRAFMLKVDLGAAAPGKLSYRIETLDGRVSQVFETSAVALADGGFGARVAHEIALQQDPGEAEAFARVAFSAPSEPVVEDDPDFFERLFGTARERDPSKGLSQQSFRVKIVAPNEVVSTYDRPTVTCEHEEILRAAAADQHDHEHDRDTPDRPGRDTPGRDGGRGTDAAGGPVD